MKKFAFIGAGNMGGALLRQVCRAIGPEQVVFYRPNREAARLLREETGCACAESAAAAAASARFVMLCVKPQILREVLEELTPTLEKAGAAGEKPVLVSIAAGVRIEELDAVLKQAQLALPIVRLMPNTPVSVGEGVVLAAAGEGVSQEDYEVLSQALCLCGRIERVTERELDLGMAISGCGPAFAYLFIEAMADGGVEAGLSREKAQTWAAQTVLGAARMVLETGKHPGALKDAVCSPGGTTIAGVAELEKRGFRSAAAQAVVAAYRRSEQLGK